MKATYKCNRCNSVFKKSEQFDVHTCIANNRNLSDIPQDLLLEIIVGKITEAQAWEIIDQKVA